jgi:hypothetical protein
VQAPWQNGLAERWVGSCCREILDHVIALNEQHLRRLVRDYVSYYHDDRIHDSLDKDTPNRRSVESKPSASATSPLPVSVAFIIDIAGAKLRKARSPLSTQCCYLRSGAGMPSAMLNSPCQNRRFSASRKSFGIDVNGGKLEAHYKESARRP